MCQYKVASTVLNSGQQSASIRVIYLHLKSWQHIVISRLSYWLLLKVRSGSQLWSSKRNEIGWIDWQRSVMDWSEKKGLILRVTFSILDSWHENTCEKCNIMFTKESQGKSQGAMKCWLVLVRVAQHETNCTVLSWVILGLQSKRMQALGRRHTDTNLLHTNEVWGINSM